MPAPENDFHLLSKEESNDRSVESEMNQDEDNADENSSTKNPLLTPVQKIVEILQVIR